MATRHDEEKFATTRKKAQTAIEKPLHWCWGERMSTEPSGPRDDGRGKEEEEQHTSTATNWGGKWPQTRSMDSEGLTNWFRFNLLDDFDSCCRRDADDGLRSMQLRMGMTSFDGLGQRMVVRKRVGR